MKISDLLKSDRPLFSFEFFPPKTDEGMKNLMETISALKPLQPSFVSMTYGAGGSTRAKTVQLVAEIKKHIGLEAAAHLTCVGHTEEELINVLEELEKEGVENVLALRGDPPQGQAEYVPVQGGFRYATQLVRLIKSRFTFCVGVAGYPEKHIEASSLEEDLRHLKEKVSAGSDFIITQLFFNNADYFAFEKRLKSMGISLPLIAGIMPITDFDQIKRFTTLCGAKIPDSLQQKLEQAASENKENVLRVGIEYATAQCQELLERGAPGIHFYTLNKSHATREIFLRLKQAGVVQG